MISAVSKYGAAISAKRIISTAEIEKLAATMQFGPPRPNSSPNAARSSSVNPVVPTTAWMPCIASQGTVRRAESATVKSTTTSAPASANAFGSAAIVTPSIVAPAAPGSTAATSSRSGSSGHGPTHRRAHPSAGAADAHLHRSPSVAGLIPATLVRTSSPEVFGPRGSTVPSPGTDDPGAPNPRVGERCCGGGPRPSNISG